ncbi:MAG: STAS domain-containing protein [Chloroflexi bacterium]|nr:STAS domain-containing protein [Chloroflexota bacterium]
MIINDSVSASASPWQKIPLRDWGTILLIGSGVYVVVHLLWLSFGLGGETYKALIENIALLPIALATIVLFWRAATHSALDQRTRRAWQVLTLALCFSWLGNALFFLYYLAEITPPFPSWADAAYLAYYPLLIAGILLFPVVATSQRLRATFWLDAGTVVLGGGLAVWYFVLEPTALIQFNSWLESLVALAYPAGDLITLVGIATISLRQPKSYSRHALGLLALGLIFFTIGDIRYGYLSLQEIYGDADWSGAMWVIGNFLLLLAAHCQYWYATDAHQATVAEQKSLLGFNPLPYVAVALSFGLLLFAARPIWGSPLGNLIIGVIGLTILVVTRQIIAVRVSLRAAAEQAALLTATDALAQTNTALEQRVAERTAILEEALAVQSAQANMLEKSLAVQQQLNQTIAKLSAPVIPVSDDTLVVPVVGAIDGARADVMINQVLQQIEITRARRVFVDVTGVLAADIQVAQAIVAMAGATRLLGAEMVLVGIRPEMAQVLVTLGDHFGQITTAATLQSGLTMS